MANKYCLTLRIDIDALDDIEARRTASTELMRLGIDISSTNRNIKLQKLRNGTQPVKVPIKTAEAVMAA